MILVTGGDGFVGTGLAGALSIRGVPYRLSCRAPKPGFVAVGDIGLQTNWSAALDGASVVIHLAGTAHRTTEKVGLEDYRRVNVAGSRRLAAQAVAAGVKRLVFVSSIGVLGQTTLEGKPHSETTQANPRTPYTQSKYEAELALAAYCQDALIELVIVRPPLVYGRGAKGNFGKLVKLVDAGCPLPFGSIRNRRCLISIQNLAEALIECATDPAAANETFLVAESQIVSTAEVVAAIAKGLRKQKRMLPFPPNALSWGLRAAGRHAMAEGLVQSLEIDSSKIIRRLGWRQIGTTLQNITDELA